MFCANHHTPRQKNYGSFLMTLIFKPSPLLLFVMYRVSELIMCRSFRLFRYASTSHFTSPKANSVTCSFVSNRFLSSSFHSPFLSQKIGFTILHPERKKWKLFALFYYTIYGNFESTTIAQLVVPRCFSSITFFTFSHLAIFTPRNRKKGRIKFFILSSSF